jgi:DNA-binding transcriptional ArsR family regulator
VSRQGAAGPAARPAADSARPALRARAQNLDSALRALADGNRRTILALVRDQPLAVGEITDRLPLTQQAVSHHLRVLRGAGLVTEQRVGARHLFSVSTEGLRTVREFLDGFWPSSSADSATERTIANDSAALQSSESSQIITAWRNGA